MAPKTVVLPFRGEFGIRIRYHVPRVRALERPIIVCHEPGLEALYPDCKRVAVNPREDLLRYSDDREYLDVLRTKFRCMMPGVKVLEIDRRSKLPEERFVPEPTVLQLQEGPLGEERVDVFVCPRWREYGPSKNWPAWPEVAGGLMAEGLTVFAGGTEAHSYDVPCDDRAWSYPRVLDATIEGMKRAELVLATDAGLAHLALLAGVPLLLVGSNGGLVAPGPAVDEEGIVRHESYWPIRMDRYYREPNWRGSPVEMLPDGWESPEDVVQRATELVRGGWGGEG